MGVDDVCKRMCDVEEMSLHRTLAGIKCLHYLS